VHLVINTGAVDCLQFSCVGLERSNSKLCSPEEENNESKINIFVIGVCRNREFTYQLSI